MQHARATRLAAAAVAAAFTFGCGSPTNEPSVGPGQVATIAIAGAPTGPVIAGQTVVLTVTTFDRDHQVLTGAAVTWTTSDTVVAKVSPTTGGAFVSVRNPGTVTIAAYSEDQQARVALTVVPIPVASIKLSMTSATLYTGRQLLVAATALDSLGRTLSGRTITWTSSNAQVASVDTGLVAAVSQGTATISAASEGKSAAFPVSVIARPVADWSGVTADWLDYQGDAKHTGYIPATIDPGVFTEAWTSTVTSNVVLNPVTVADGHVFVSTKSYFGTEILDVLDASTGGVQWTHDFGGINSVDPPTYSNGSVYVATGGQSDSYIWGFNVADGSTRFRTPYGNQWSSYFTPVVSGDTLFMAGGTYGGMYAFSTDDGRQLWFAALNQYDEFTPAVAGGLVYAYTGSYSPELTVANATTGVPVFQIPDSSFNWDGWSMNTAPVLGAANDVIDTQGGRLLEFDLGKRQIAWQIPGGFGGQPSVANGIIYVAKAGQVEAHRESDGGFLWAWVPPTGSVAGPMIVTKNILIASTGAATYVVDLATRGTTWSYPAGGQLAISKTGVLYIARTTGQLTAINVK